MTLEDQDNNSFSVELHQVPIEWNLKEGTVNFFDIKSVLFWINPSLFTILKPLADEITICSG